MDIRAALLQGQKLFEDAAIAAPRLTAEVLLAHAIGCERAWLFAHSDEPLREVWWIHYGRYLHERMQGKPTQYITGRQEFYGRDFRVTPDVLIPRPETEHVVEVALKGTEAALKRREAASGQDRLSIIDIGTGSGAIAVTLALETNASVIATDISTAALCVASENARLLKAPVHFVACDLADGIAGGRFDLVVSNPPYVPESDSSTIQREVRDYEPAVALYGGADGFEVYRRLIPEAARLLKPGGWLVMEIGYRSGEGVAAMLSAASRPLPDGRGSEKRTWCEVETIPDLAGLPRVMVARR
jgi:release factor glutamine methyltransferase